MQDADPADYANYGWEAEQDWADEEGQDWDKAEERDTFDMVDDFWTHVNIECPGKWDSANEFAGEVNFEWSPERMDDAMENWAEQNDCMG
jgi:hypothetical protein